MTKQQLQESIDNVKKLIKGSLDTHERDLLGHLMERVVKGSGDKPEGLEEQLEEQAVDFETRHPTIAKALREVGDILNKMGI